MPQTGTRAGPISRWLHADIRLLPPAQRRRAVLAGLAAVLLAVAIALVNWFTHGPNHDQFDLRIYHSAVRFWLDGNSLYDYSQPDAVNGALGYTYPPVFAVLMAPMALLPVGLVVAGHLVLLLACSLWLTWIYLRRYWTLGGFQTIVVTATVCALGFALEPMSQNVGFGQVNLVLAVLVVLDVLVLGPRGSGWYGVGIGVALACKLTPGIFLLLLVLQRRWRALATAVVSTLVMIGIGFAVNGADSVRYYGRLIWQSERVGSLDSPVNQSWNGFVARFSAEVPSRVWWALGVLVVLVVGSIRIARALRRDDLLVALTLTGIVGALVSPVTWVHHVVWVVPAGIVLCRYIRVAGADGALRTSARAVLLAVTGVYVWSIDVARVFGLPNTGFAARPLIDTLLASQQLLWLVLALVLLPMAPAASDDREDARLASPHRG